MLNEWGLLVWRHKTNQNLFVQRTYHWCDRVVILDETFGRQVVKTTEFSTFDFTDWIPVTAEQYSRVKHKFKEIYNELLQPDV